MSRLLNAIKLLFGKLVVEITINEKQTYCVVPSGIILKLNSSMYELPMTTKLIEKGE